MLRYLSLRLLYTLPVVWLVVSLVFLLIHLVPGDPILQMLGESAPATDIQAARHQYGLDVPLGQQYIHYWKGVLHGDLGPSVRFNQSVTSLIAQRYPYTLQLTIAALIVGGVRSMFTVAVALALLPALSVALPVTNWPPPWLVSIVGPLQLATPEVASEQVKLTVTGVLFQPLPLERGTRPEVIDGSVLSILTAGERAQ